jgi:pyruvate/2-oxoglutarate dehydrogenase complex dihydrolipoamide dehydrogenase (E3) component
LELTNNETIQFDKLVIATGSSYSLPIKESAAGPTIVASRGAHLVAAHQKLRLAQRVIVIGGGIVGVELGNPSILCTSTLFFLKVLKFEIRMACVTNFSG